ncbi:hypothetical protein ACFSHP_04090 [Novosphingobium panipatense]
MIRRFAAFFAPPDVAASSPSRSSVILLTQLRWIAVFGQLATIIVVATALDVRLPLAPLLLAPLLLILVNVAVARILLQRRAFSQRSCARR